MTSPSATYVAPENSASSWHRGMVVTRRPRITSAAARISIPWQIEATGLLFSKKCFVMRIRS